MAERNEDSGLTALNDLRKLEREQGAQRGERSRMLQERQRAAEDAVRRSREAENARIEEEKLRRDVEARMELERANRELHLRLEVEQRARLEARVSALAHEESLARLAKPAKGRMSWTMGVVCVALALGADGVAAFVAKAQVESQAYAESLVRAANTPALSPIPDNSALRTQIARDTARATTAQQDAVRILTRSHGAIAPRDAGTTHVRPGNPATTPLASTLGWEHLEDGPDPVTSTGVEGSRRNRRR